MSHQKIDQKAGQKTDQKIGDGTIAWEDFAKVDIRLGTIVSAEVFEAARKPAYILHVDFGDAIGVKKSSAQITALYTPEDLVGKRVFAVVNFPPKQIAHIMSECLVMGVHGAEGAVTLATLDAVDAEGATAENGARLL